MDAQIIRALIGTANQPELTFRRSYRASQEELFAAWTRPDRLARWFGTITGDPVKVGDSFTAQLTEDDPQDRAEGRVVACEPNRLAVTWAWHGEPESVITVRLTPDEIGTEVTLHHAMAHPRFAVGYGGGWEQALQSLARALNAADPDAPADADIEAAGVEAWRTITRAPLELEQVLPAPIERVWKAFTTVPGLEVWWWRHWDDTEIDAHPRVGGTYRMASPKVGVSVRGEYLTVEEPHRLAFTWEWTDEDGAGVVEAVDIRLVDEGSSTRLLLRHSGPWADDVPAENYRQGWEFVLAELNATLSA